MKLFEPGKIGRLSVKNRVVMLPMITKLQELDGSLSRRAIDFYTARAKGGVGMIISSLWGIEREIEPKMEGPRCALFMADGFTYVDRISQLADAVHDYGAKLAVQLNAGFGRILSPQWIQWQAPRPPVAPSAQPCLYAPEIIARALTTEDIQKLVNAFGLAARVASSAGVDAIEVHGVGGYLIDQFMTAKWNHRTDRYGGSLDGRLRFPLEIIETIKANAGMEYPVIFRYAAIHDCEGGRELEESLEIARRLEKAGVDALSVVVGCHDRVRGLGHPRYLPPGQWIDYAEAVKKVVKIPVIAAGRLGYPELAESILEEGKADFIGLGRGLLADPEWPNKVCERKLDDLQICIGCGEGCQRRAIHANRYISCALTSTTGMEREFTLTPVDKRRSVLVVGGGPAGMEAARVAAVRGHQVTLWEKTDKLGGNLLPASVPDFKQDIRSLIDYLSNQIKKLGVTIELCKEGTPELIQRMDPDILIVATGATPIISGIPGIERDSVVTAVDLLLGKKEAGEKVVVVGGGMIGCEVALCIAQKGKNVTVVEMTPNLAADMYVEQRRELIWLLNEDGVKLLAETIVLEITDDGVIVSGKSGKETLEADTVVLALGLKPETRLSRTLEERGSKALSVGDCVEPRKIINAIWEGFRTARLI